MAFVGDVEPLVHPYEHVKVDDQDLDGEVEDVEACFALIRGRVGPWPRPACEVDSDAESGPRAEEGSGYEQNCHLVPEPAAAEFLHTGLARYDETADDERDGQKGYDGVVGLPVELDVAVDAFGVGVECVEALDDSCDDGNETDDNDDVLAYKSPMEEWMPPCVRMAGADYALGE